MINEIKIYNRFNMDMFVRTGGLNFPYMDRPWYLVSIHSDIDDALITEKTQQSLVDLGCRDAISLRFWDITKDTVDSLCDRKDDEQSQQLCEQAVLFSPHQAKTIIGFLISCNQDDETNGVLVAHCDAGVSRSGAVGVFTVDFLRLDYANFIKQNEFLKPNIYVSNILRRTAGMTPQFIEETTSRDDDTMEKEQKIIDKAIKNGKIF